MAESWVATFIGILTNPLVLLFALLTLAYGADRILRADGRVLPIMILVVSPFIGWVARYELPEEMRTLGLIMFIYVVGLETGSEFFPTFRQHWKRFIALGLLASGTAGLLAWGIGRTLDWKPATTAAFYAGAVTNTPAFEWLPKFLQELPPSAAPQDSLSAAQPYDVAPVVATFDLSYFMGVLGAVAGLIVFHLIWTRRTSERSCPVSFSVDEKAVAAPYFVSVHRCTNKTIIGRPLAEVVMEGIPHSLAIRIEREGVVSAVNEETLCHGDDRVVLVSCSPDLTRMAQVLLGPAVEMTKDAPLVSDLPVRFETVVVNSQRFAGAPVTMEHIEEEYAVEVRGWWRGREYMPAERTMRWRLGDRLRVLGTDEKVRAFRYAVEEKDRAQTEEIDLLRFSIGAVVAMFLSGIVVPMGQHFRLTLGVTGAPLLAGLLFGRSARIQIPRGAGFFLKELGLGLFLASVGTNVGMRGALSPSDLLLLPLALVVVGVPMVMTALWLKYAGFGGQHVEGGLCGAVTSTTALMVSCRLSDSAEPANTYAGIYLFALLAGVAAAQILYILG